MRRTSGFDAATRQAIRTRDGGCLGPRAGLPGPCVGGLEIDHIRASHALGMKSESTRANGATLCWGHHRYKTEHGRLARPSLIAVVDSLERGGES